MRAKCVIIDGPQGCGKTTLVNYIRENMPASNLYRLSGQKDKTKEGKEKSKKMYYALLEYMDAISASDINLIFDRIFFTEEVFSLLGYKEYDFTDVYKKLLKKLGNLDYDIYYICLYVEDTEVYKKRLKRSHHDYQKFSIESSIRQQETYRSLNSEIDALPNTTVYEVAMDDFDKAYKKIDEILDIVKKEWN